MSKAKPIDSFDACEDYFILVIEVHVVAAGIKLLEMQDLSDAASKRYAGHVLK